MTNYKDLISPAPSHPPGSASKQPSTPRPTHGVTVLISIEKEGNIDTTYTLRRTQFEQLLVPEIFNEYLDCMDKDESGNIWNLLGECPLNPNMKSQILQVPIKQNISKFIKRSEPLKTRYYLQIINQLIFKEKNETFIKGLASSKQLEELIRCASNLDILNLNYVTAASVTTYVKGIFPIVQYYYLPRYIEVYIAQNQLVLKRSHFRRILSYFTSKRSSTS